MIDASVLRAAMEQSAADSGCMAEDFLKSEPVAVLSKKNDGARRYLDLPFFCDLTSYGNNVVASAAEEFLPHVRAYLEKYPAAHCFETPNMRALESALNAFGMGVCFMAEYFLPSVNMPFIAPPFETRVLEKERLNGLYLPEWSNALCEKRRSLDMLAVGAYENGRLVALAGASADCETMWQIGVDVLPEARRRGAGAAIVSALAKEVFARGKIPFYCAAWSNLRSVKTALKCGFEPAWAQLTAKPLAFIDELNR
ncbi:MAG: GNAT family N-acetyltransferase [Bacillota bacterium]|nr:MAG: GNAT family N-acetyltransferase [Bacillota bacterium]